jgi:hypothetical protein
MLVGLLQGLLVCLLACPEFYARVMRSSLRLPLARRALPRLFRRGACWKVESLSEVRTFACLS